MGPDQQKKVGTLSGGERNRVHLAKLLRGGANLLLLDEPTNDLDVDTLRSLEEGITSFAGSVVVITHDRWFLDRLATHAITDEPLGDDVLAGALGGSLSAIVLVTADDAPRRATLVERLVRQGFPVRWIVVVPPDAPTRIERANGTPDRVSMTQIEAEEPLAL